MRITSSRRYALFARPVTKAMRQAKLAEAKVKYARKLLRVCARSMKATRRSLRKALREEDVPSCNVIQDSSSLSGGRDLEPPPSPTSTVKSYASSWDGIHDPLSSSSSEDETSDDEYDPHHPEYILPANEYYYRVRQDVLPGSLDSSTSSQAPTASSNSLQDNVPSDERQEAAGREDIIAGVDFDGFHFLHSFEDESFTDYTQMHTRAEDHVDADGFHFLVFWPERGGSAV